MIVGRNMGKKPWISIGRIFIGVITLIFITSVLLLAGEIQFSVLDLVFSPKGRLTIDIQPYGSEVYVDESLEGVTPLVLDIGGAHKIRVEKIGYSPFEIEIDIRDEPILLVDKLALIPFGKEIHAPVHSFTFLANSSITYSTGDRIYIWNPEDRRDTHVSTLPVVPDSTHLSPEGNEALYSIVGLYNLTLDYFSIVNNKYESISSNIKALAWGPQPGEYSVISSSSGKYRFDIYSGDELYVSNIIEESVFIQGLNWSPSGIWFVVEAIGNISIYSYEDNDISREKSIQPAYFPQFSPVTDNIISYVDDVLNLKILDLEEDNQVVNIGQISMPYQWQRDGKAIIYAKYNSDQGTTALWEVDVSTGNKTLLVDPFIVWGKVVDFKMSPDGKMIAYLTDNDRLMVLVLDD